MANTKKWRPPALPEAPLIVFINSRSGGRVGPALTEVLYRALGHDQACVCVCVCVCARV